MMRDDPRSLRRWIALAALASAFLVSKALVLAALGQRVPWTTSRVVGSPDPPPLFQVERAWPELKFKEPVDLCRAAVGSRLFVAEQAGKLFSFDAAAAQPKLELVLDLRSAHADVSALYGFAFHPGFATNRYVYFCYVLKDGAPDGSRVSRFEVAQTEPPRVDPASEQVIITWLGGGHNGGCLKFGPDGYLYISTGDGAGPNPPDLLKTGQDLGDLLSSIVRIDVDHPTGANAYGIPSDNPFRQTPGARPEVWAYGLRNPWRMSFDRATGSLWVADVGWELWEMVYRVERGGNYGWSIVEGPQSIHPDWKSGPSPILPPAHAHSHTEAASITGGLVYHGTALTNLFGAYIYGDWVTGKIWALRASEADTTVNELVDTTLQLVSFADDSDGELLILDYAGGIYRLRVNSASGHETNFPRLLSETGLFTAVKEHQLAPGVVPFSVNAPMWLDYAAGERFIGLPERSVIQVGRGTPTDPAAPNWRFPINAVLGRTLSLELDQGRPESRRRMETQLLHFDGQDWHGYTYRWNDAQTDAHLVDRTGDTRSVRVGDEHAPDVQRDQNWRFHSRSECLRCHNPWTGGPLAFIGPQLEGATHPGQEDELGRLCRLGLFNKAPARSPDKRLANPYDEAADLSRRARSWLHVNCSHCHREGAGGSVVSHFDFDKKLSEMKAVGQAPSQGTLGLNGAQVICAGLPWNSVLFYRISTSGQGRMPLIGSSEPDPRGVRLMGEWIRQLAAANNDDMGAALRTLRDANASAASRRTALDNLLSSPNGALALLISVEDQSLAEPASSEWRTQVAQNPSFQVRELFWRFLPETLRPKRLGLDPKHEQILSLRGDAARGRIFFFGEGVQCARCHRLQGQGREFGPDLSQIGRKYSPAELLDQVLNPSKLIDPAYRSYQVETSTDQLYSGFIVKRTADWLVVREPEREVQILAAQVKSTQPQQLSAMPEGLLQNVTAQDAADLVAFLGSLR